jgi:hypothetical protein
VPAHKSIRGGGDQEDCKVLTPRGQVHVFGLCMNRVAGPVSRKMYPTPDFAVLSRGRRGYDPTSGSPRSIMRKNKRTDASAWKKRQIQRPSERFACCSQCSYWGSPLRKANTASGNGRPYRSTECMRTKRVPSWRRSMSHEPDGAAELMPLERAPVAGMACKEWSGTGIPSAVQSCSVAACGHRDVFCRKTSANASSIQENGKVLTPRGQVHVFGEDMSAVARPSEPKNGPASGLRSAPVAQLDDLLGDSIRRRRLLVALPPGAE